MEVRRLFFQASSTLTFSPIYKEDWQAQVNNRVEEGIELMKAEQQAGNFLVKEFLEQEMGIKERHLEEVMEQVVEIFPKNRTEWNTLAVRFENTAVAEGILREKAKMRTFYRDYTCGQFKSAARNWARNNI